MTIMLSDLNHLRLLDALGKAHSLSGAASLLKLPLATVSRQLKALEQEQAQRVLDRSARRFHLTEYGAELVQIATRSLDELQSATAKLNGDQQALRGEIRLTAPADFALRYLSAPIKAFRDRFPGIRFALTLTVRRVNLVEEGFDLAIRIGPIQADALIPRKLMSIARGIYASCAFAHAAPVRLEDADQLPWVHLGAAGPVRVTLINQNNGKETNLTIAPVIAADSVSVCAALVRDGAGCALLPEVWMRESVQNGSVVRLWPDFATAAVDAHLLYAERQLPARVRQFVEFLVDWFAKQS
jgi:DNA-binding transcriptional LysR family regulator